MRTVLVFDATTVLGSSVASRLAQHGDRLLLFGRDLSQLEELDASLCQAELHRYWSLESGSPESETAALTTQLRVCLGDGTFALHGVVLSLRATNPVSQLGELLTALAETFADAPGGRVGPVAIVLLLEASLAGAESPSGEALHSWHGAIQVWGRRLARDSIRLNCVQVHNLLTPERTAHAEALAAERDLLAQNVLSEWSSVVPLGSLPRPETIAALASELLGQSSADLTCAVLKAGE